MYCTVLSSGLSATYDGSCVVWAAWHCNFCQMSALDLRSMISGSAPVMHLWLAGTSRLHVDDDMATLVHLFVVCPPFWSPRSIVVESTAQR